MPYIHLNPSLLESNELFTFAEQLGPDVDQAQGLGRLVMLWMFAANHPDRPVTARRLSYICRWLGEPAVLVSALLAGGWVEEAETGKYKIVITEQEERMRRRREANRERSRKWRAAQRCKNKTKGSTLSG